LGLCEKEIPVVLENVPASSQSDGRWRLTLVPLAANALSVAILNGATAKPFTYGLTPDGWKYDKTQATVEDKRLTLVQDLERPGKVKEMLEIRYVRSTDPASANALFIPGSEGKINIRTAIDNAALHVVGGIADVITFVAGVQRRDAPTENGLDTITQKLFITAPTVTDAVLIA
jgi:hypothetical protein